MIEPGALLDGPATAAPLKRGAAVAVAPPLPVRLLRLLAPTLLVALLAACAAWVTRGALIDDAYITLTYARNLAEHGTWGLLSDVPSATATSPLWVLVLAGLTSLTADPFTALALAHVGVSAGLVPVLSALARRTHLPVWTGPAAAAAVVVQPLLLSVTGMESGLLVLLLAAATLAGAAGRPVLFGLLAGAVFLTRMDAGPTLVLLALLSPPVLRRLHLAVLPALAVALSWMSWSWYALGTAIPDTFLIKTQQGSFGPWTVGNGWGWYRELYGTVAVVAFAPMLLAALALVVLVALLRRRSGPGVPRTLPWLALTAAGAGHWLTLVVLGVPPYHWYFAPVLGLGTVGAVAATAALVARRARLRVVVAALLLVQIGASLVVDAARHQPWRVMPIQTNYATSARYEVMGADLAAELRGRRVMTFGEIGHLAYVCDCVVDGFADPARVVPGIRKALADADGAGRWLLELNYRHRDLGAAEVPVAGSLRLLKPHEVPAGSSFWHMDLYPWRRYVALVLDPPEPA
ncbi:hypothetical protein CLV92_103186 [Kineococcus xinjiangensis]|uniref:4-amino-4-deoxy-L-arabinose transferase-like glycosyltransferase n=1 Tax=Kineococcus xinjiangensis TaxID=512762 RepID=A0A2S6IU07_9ACTN|nr:hypothetical protein [Kineococcus xinjiangensis]PPK97651.1 hypothetical protein CLV92_103186 [Kineococcus xinjiangensis]